MAWVWLILAGLLEVGWAMGLKLSDGLTKPLYAVPTIVLMVASFALLSLAMRTLPLGTSYAVWTGIGAVGSVIVGIVFLSEPATLIRLGSIGLILVGIVGLKLAAAH